MYAWTNQKDLLLLKSSCSIIWLESNRSSVSYISPCILKYLVPSKESLRASRLVFGRCPWTSKTICGLCRSHFQGATSITQKPTSSRPFL